MLLRGENITQTCMDVSTFCGFFAGEVTDAVSTFAAYFSAWRVVKEDAKDAAGGALSHQMRDIHHIELYQWDVWKVCWVGDGDTGATSAS